MGRNYLVCGLKLFKIHVWVLVSKGKIDGHFKVNLAPGSILIGTGIPTFFYAGLLEKVK